MTEPDNHTHRILREFRNEFRNFGERTDSNFSRLEGRIDSIRQALAGESVLGRYAAAEVEERLAAIEKRLSDLEGRR